MSKPCLIATGDKSGVTVRVEIVQGGVTEIPIAPFRQDETVTIKRSQLPHNVDTVVRWRAE